MYNYLPKRINKGDEVSFNFKYFIKSIRAKEIKILVIIIGLYESEIINKQALLAYYKLLRENKLYRRLNTHKCHYNNKWYYNTDTHEVFDDLANLINPNLNIELSKLIKHWELAYNIEGKKKYTRRSALSKFTLFAAHYSLNIGCTKGIIIPKRYNIKLEEDIDTYTIKMDNIGRKVPGLIKHEMSDAYNRNLIKYENLIDNIYNSYVLRNI